MKKIVVVIAVLVLYVCSYLLFAGDNSAYRVIVNAANPVIAVSKKDLAKIFLKKVDKWDNGYEVHPVDLIENSPVRYVFTEEIHEKEIANIIAYWNKEFFKNQTSMPPQMQNEWDVISYIESDSGAIGYISSAIPINGYQVKELAIEY
ncbi:substrate-binding domain-containing protein [bacterium]|nr:substrate-binding domain-containing protein [bacterium]